jgi:hypothetical protein
VSNSETYTLSYLGDAIRTLSGAVDRLEAVAATRLAGGDLLLAGELRGARDDYDTLQDTTRVVGARLDHAIDRIRILLEE